MWWDDKNQKPWRQSCKTFSTQQRLKASVTSLKYSTCLPLSDKNGVSTPVFGLIATVVAVCPALFITDGDWLFFREEGALCSAEPRPSQVQVRSSVNSIKIVYQPTLRTEPNFLRLLRACDLWTTTATLLEKFWRISLCVTDVAIGLLYVT